MPELEQVGAGMMPSYMHGLSSAIPSQASVIWSGMPQYIGGSAHASGFAQYQSS
jgi:hypothetical protein